MARSTQMMIVGLPFCLAAVIADGLPMNISAAIGLFFIITGCGFWMADGK